jgi:hypothetical protein
MEWDVIQGSGIVEKDVQNATGGIMMLLLDCRTFMMSSGGYICFPTQAILVRNCILRSEFWQGILRSARAY